MSVFSSTQTSSQSRSTSLRYAVLDVETTGFSPDLGDEIIEIACQRIVNGKVIDTYQSLVRPVRRPSSASEAVHGITWQMLEIEGRAIEHVLDEFIPFIENTVLVGHNIPFDLSFINAHLSRLNLPSLTHSTVDTCQLARQHLIIPRYTLESVARYLKVPQPSAHRALADVETTREVFFRLMQRIKEKETSRVR